MAKVLVIEDDPASRRMIGRILAQGGHRAIEADNGLAGMAKLRAEQPDLVIMDIIMPYQDGLQTLREMRDEGSRIAVIAISGGGVGSSALYLSIAKEMGADAVIEKPFRAEALAAAVRQVLQRAAAA